MRVVRATIIFLLGSLISLAIAEGAFSQQPARGQKSDGPGRRGRAESDKSGQAPQFTAPALAKDDAEGKVLQSLADMRKKQGPMSNVPEQDGRMLRLLAESMGAKAVVEIGTSNGVSAIWLCQALRRTGGRLITHEIDPKCVAIARENFVSAGVADLVTIVEGDAHAKVSDLKGPIDLVFIDADKDGYLDYFKKTLPLVRPGGLVLAHNMNSRMVGSEFVKAISTHPDVETIFYMEGNGMSITLKKH